MQVYVYIWVCIQHGQEYEWGVVIQISMLSIWGQSGHSEAQLQREQGWQWEEWEQDRTSGGREGERSMPLVFCVVVLHMIQDLPTKNEGNFWNIWVLIMGIIELEVSVILFQDFCTVFCISRWNGETAFSSMCYKVSHLSLFSWQSKNLWHYCEVDSTYSSSLIRFLFCTFSLL